MDFKRKRLFSFVLSFLLIIGMFSLPAQAEEETVQLTIIGTTDIHANIYNWSYEDGEEVEDLGLTKVYSVIEEIREENPNTLLLDNGDTIQGTILADDLYNTKLEEPHPVIDVMNFMKYDSMTLGNHEFNFGLDLIEKIVEEAEFPILGANIYWKDGTNFVKPYIIKEVAGVKVGILGLGNPNIPRWDGPKVTELEFEAIDKAADKYVDELKDQVDIIVAVAHAGLEEEYSEADSVKLAIEKNPEIDVALVGHSHASVAETLGNTVVGGARDAGRQVVRFDLTLKEEGENWEIIDKEVELIEVTDYEASEELKEYAKKYHETTLEFLEDVIGQATEDFHPASEVKGIPEGQIRDTAVMDLINDVQLKYSGADISSAALFQPSSNIRKGDITYSSIFDIYKYPNTLVGVEITGKELKDYMEWSASYYNTYKPGDVTISFDPDIRAYNYDMFQGVDYKIDISKPAGERIVDLKFKGKPVKDDDTFKLTINNYRLSGLQSMGIISGEAYFNSDPISLRSYIAQHISELGTIEPKVDNNWEIIGADLEHPLRDYVIQQVNEGKIEIPASEDGRSINSKALNVYELIEEGLIPEEILKEHTSSIEVEGPEIEEEVKVEEVYSVKVGDVLWRIAEKFNTTWEKLAEYNNLANPHLIFPGQEILIP
ncbi:5'-nucleotidase C-terminal domain-containing protein [Schnuerera sp.]|uniref:5'-nucleotidase C-terminal domain-containing protein n=1 Tax=Schnuerera sp. TaxID=2794844 RepID=UPI002B65508F|nr:5'-nucleotidase C-terminal domain-containing protein [Schnuerera sp.]HSH36585.1 5'-nucleotidase C-terminal domain-containing protein [Schnuerera sp.]